MTETTPDEDVRFVLRNELRLYDPGVRGAPGELEALLHPDFVEFGPSGLRWDRREIIAALTAVPPPGGAAPLGAGGPAGPAGPAQQATVVSELAGIRLSSTIVLVTYVSEQEGRRARHSSLWLRTGPGWRLYFHQGTLMPSG